ncbi:hypothetical protein Tco_0722045 [Tanacetum coccineum]
MQNNIMAAGTRDRPPNASISLENMPQWHHGCFLVDSRNVEATKGYNKVNHSTFQDVKTKPILGVGNNLTVANDAKSMFNFFNNFNQKCQDLSQFEATTQSWMRNFLKPLINKNVDTTPRYKNDNQTGQFRNQRAVNIAGARETVGIRKPKRVKDSTYHKEKMLLCKQAEKGVQLQAEQSDCYDTDEEIDEQELEAHYSYMAKIQEVPNADSGTDSEPLEQNDSFAFVHELKQEMHADLKYVESLEDELDEFESDKAEFSNMYDMLLQECVSNDIMCSYLQSSSDLDEITELQCLYLHKVRRYLKPQLQDKNIAISGVKETPSKNAKENLFLNDVNARTKKPNIVPISTRKPKSQANKSAATPHKKTVASESTITNSKSYYRMLYKKTNKGWKWIQFSMYSIVQFACILYKLILHYIVDSGMHKEHMTGQSISAVNNTRTKHIHTRYHFIKEQVENGIIELYFVRTEYQLADMFTKALPEERFQYLVRRIGMRCLTPAELEVLTKESA